MNTPIGDDELTLYFYDDGLLPARRAELTQRLRSDLDLARRYQQLRAELAALPPPAERQPSAAALARWTLRLDQRAATPAAAHAPHWRLAFAGATLVLLGVAVGTRLVEAPTVAAPAPAPIVAAAAEDADGAAPALSRGLSSYLGDARLVLADLPADDPQRRRELVDEVIEQNRMYARAAQAQGDERLARVLRAFEPVLLALAEPPSAADGDLGARSQIDFELGILQTKLARSPSKIVQTL
jgi:hypothetical protein